MMHVHVLRPGPMVTVQDAGRRGLLQYGVSASGPMDAAAHRIALALVGAAGTDAALEFAYVGGAYRATAPLRVAVTGGDVEVWIDDEPVLPWSSHWLHPGQTLRVGALRGAVWGYIAFSGGIATSPVLQARATHLRTALGGLAGRVLAAGDILPVGPDTSMAPCRTLRLPWRHPKGPLRVVPGPQDDYFDDEAWQAMLRRPFTVSARRDRMATVLEGNPIRAARGHDIVSDGTPLGSIQVPGSGDPLVLMAERQTTGGYPKIATVASFDLPRLAQAASGSRVRLMRVSVEEAQEGLIACRETLRRIIGHLEAQ